MDLRVLPQKLSICKVLEVPAGALGSELCFVGKTDEELSLVCETALVPVDVIERDDGWRAFRIEGVLDFALTGILARISAVLAEAGIAIFTVSTFNTDYILVKEERLPEALGALSAAGYVCLSNGGEVS